MGVRTEVISRRCDSHAKCCDRVKAGGETEIDRDLVCAPGIKPKHRNRDIASGINVTARFQIRSSITHVNRPGNRTGLWLNLELGEPEAADIAEPDPNQTNEW